jgi:hypothetical protein
MDSLALALCACGDALLAPQHGHAVHDARSALLCFQEAHQLWPANAAYEARVRQEHSHFPWGS